ncbi:hypothetical protein [Arthrobacter ipis]|uniref:hypothetical protein n=1 Tax=Arthrobacter ipis TaxID=2716202 RepID=UPI001FE8B897|nr:hypothetical protein [Arthrobacter ipis]
MIPVAGARRLAGSFHSFLKCPAHGGHKSGSTLALTLSAGGATAWALDRFVVHHNADGKLVATFVTTKATGSLVFSAAAIEAGKQYTVYTGGTAKVESGLGEGCLDGGTVTAGEYTQGSGPGGR